MLRHKHWAIRYGYLAGSIVLVAVFMFVAAPALSHVTGIRPMAVFIEESGIDAGALYYTDIEVFSEAEVNMQNTMDYTPLGGL